MKWYVDTSIKFWARIVSVESTPNIPDFGLTVDWFLSSLTYTELRSLLNSDTLSLLDAFSGGEIPEDKLEIVARELIDFESLLDSDDGREFIFNHLPTNKVSELARRVELSEISYTNFKELSKSTVLEFFGLEIEPSLVGVKPNDERVEPSYGLFDYQRVAVKKTLELLNFADRRTILHLPTGSGKTRTAMHVVANVLSNNEPCLVVWLASGKELLEQSVSAFRAAWKSLGSRQIDVVTMMGDNSPNLNELSDGFLAISLAKGWARKRNDPDWALRLAKKIRLVVFDEAHQCIARTYQNLTEELTMDCRCALLGLTATPGRTWSDIDEDGKLATFFAGNKVSLDVPGDNPIQFLINHKFLARPTFKTLLSEPGMVFTPAELKRISTGLDIPEDVIGTLSKSNQYVSAVLNAIQDLLDNGNTRVIVFAGSVEQANILNAVLTARRVMSDVVTADTNVRTRERVIKDFSSREPIARVLLNYGVLTTGFDVPKISAVVIARPTRSLVLFSQMVGRAIRGPKAGGTKTCEVITVVDPSLTGFGDVAEAFLNWEDIW